MRTIYAIQVAGPVGEPWPSTLAQMVAVDVAALRRASSWPHAVVSAEADLRAAAHAAGEDPDAAVQRARDRHATGLEHPAEAYEGERRRLLAGRPRARTSIVEVVEADGPLPPSPACPARPRGLTGLCWARLGPRRNHG